jgi:class 3 adenylate cyclase
LKKIIYLHQLLEIKNGKELESTMPTTSSQACVISFDIVGSSKIKHIKAKTFFRNVFARCNELMVEGYDGKKLKSKAYRIKEMGDGFLCSVGYPFESITDNPAIEAVVLSRSFARILKEESARLSIDILCGIGIASDTITGFYPEVGTKEYDLYGPGIILATRYEGMRKALFKDGLKQSVLIIQENVYESLSIELRSQFIEEDLQELGIVVRDDPSAIKIYYQFLDAPLA